MRAGTRISRVWHPDPHGGGRAERGRTSPARARQAVAIAVACLALAACRQDMHDAPRYDPLEASAFFADGQASRPLVANTVARGHLRDDDHLYTGKIGEELATEFPMPVTAEIMARGQERFNVFCSPCHGRTGDGNGMIVQRGFRQPPSFHEDRLVNAPVGYLFDVMTNGFGAMQDYATQVPVPDRWAIAAYMRALQFSRRASLDDVPAERRVDLDRNPPAPPIPGQVPDAPGAAPADGPPGPPPAGAAPGQPPAAPGGPQGSPAPPQGAPAAGPDPAQENE